MLHVATASRRDLARGSPSSPSARPLAPGRRPAVAQAGPASPRRRGQGAPTSKFKGLNEGKNADYIPALAKVPSNYFGIALATPQGKLSTAGDIEPTFSIQSISKVFTLALVFQESGEELIENSHRRRRHRPGVQLDRRRRAVPRQGDEPAGQPGRHRHHRHGQGHAGRGVEEDPGDLHSDFAGRQLAVDQEVYKSEADTNQRNRAIGALMWAYERFQSDPAVATDIYTRQCAIAVNAKDLGNMAATLANGGKNPLTKKQVIDPSTCRGSWR